MSVWTGDGGARFAANRGLGARKVERGRCHESYESDESEEIAEIGDRGLDFGGEQNAPQALDC